MEQIAASVPIIPDVLPKRRDVRRSDRFFFWGLRTLALLLMALLGAIIFLLFRMSEPILTKIGYSFFTFNEWNPVTDEFGALAFVFGTVVSSVLAILLATPVSIGGALVLTELAPKFIGSIVGFLIEMLAAIPSVVYGLWGIFIMAPFLREFVQPWLGENLGFLPLFQGPPFGVGMMSAGIILAIMIVPTITAICREVFRAIPQGQREAALALGATRWEMIVLSVLKSSYSGIFGAVILGLGRALGETMAVTMVIGNRPDITASLFAPAQTMASIIANEYAEATSDMHLAALTAVGLGLFAVSLFINTLARYIIGRVEGKNKVRA